jgi:hypothetical protein
MWTWLLNLAMSFLYSDEVKALAQAGIQDLVSTGKGLAVSALKFSKEANDLNVENKFDYVQEKMLAEFSTVGKSKINTAIELAVSSLQQGLSK